MIRTLFDSLKPAYIQRRGGRLLLSGREFDGLDVAVRGVVPVRKLFDGAKLVCWSVDGSPGRGKRQCAFCPDERRCQRRLRLNLVARGDDGGETPAVVELRASAFDAVDMALEGEGGNDQRWDETLFRLRVAADARGFEDFTLERIF
jgi:hypothetical protein